MCEYQETCHILLFCALSDLESHTSSSAFDMMTMLKILRLVAATSARKSAVHCSSAACPQSLVPTSVNQCFLAETVGALSPGVGRSEECACSGVCSSEPHSQWAESAKPNYLDFFFLAHSDLYADGRWWF